LDTLGCKLNQAETESLARQLARAGYMVAAPGGDFDVYVLNTCTVTATADAKSRQLLRQAHRRCPDAALLVIGCYAERAVGAIEKLPGVKLVLPNSQKDGLALRLSALGYEGGDASEASNLRTRAFVKAQQGCGNYCAYCIVPYVRGPENSRPAAEVVADVAALAASGYKEVVLTGTEVGAYSYKGIDLRGLLERILAETGIARLRLSSLQPPEVAPSLLALWRDTRLCPHFHLSLQSGSDSVLRRMNRRYDTAAYRDAVERIRRAAPDAAITTDVITGFPGETDTEFQDSYDFIKAMGFARIHVFSYTPRPGTKAADMANQVADGVKKERSSRLMALGQEAARAFRSRFVGAALEVLWEQEKDGVWSGYTGNYMRVYARSVEDLTNRISTAVMEKPYRDGLWGWVADKRK
jgi:threonylcarbamoyladenosine tRNA methylthiotransferase MtaB